MCSFCKRSSFAIAVLILAGSMPASAHPGHSDNTHHHDAVKVARSNAHNAIAIAGTLGAADSAISGQGELKFRVLYTSTHLPEPAMSVLVDAHGGFAVDRREGFGDTYFALPGAGIIKMSAGLEKTELLDTAPEVRDSNMHNTTIWYDDAGEAFLVFPANDAGKVFTTTLDGKLVNTLDAPTDFTFDEPVVDGYFAEGGKFVPTDVEKLGTLYYVTTGYSPLDYVLTAKVSSTNPFEAGWHDLVFGGKGDAPGQFGTGHGITVSPDTKRIVVADRPNAELERFTRYGQYRDTVKVPEGAFPCDVDYVGPYMVVGCLHGPDREKGAPVYILENDEVVSTIMPKEELGLENFQHIHNATGVMLDGKLYVIAQAWNPGDFAVLEQVKD